MFNLQSRRYLGCKTKLLEFIHQIINDNCNDINTFADIFGGTGVVGYSFTDECSVIINDILESNVCAYHTFFSSERFSIRKINRIIEEYNNVEVTQSNYYSREFGNTYLSKNNMKKVGYIRDDIDNKYENGQINKREKYILITSLIYAIDSIANTVGHYDAYRKNGDLSARLTLQTPNIKRLNHRNYIYQEDANELVRNIQADLVYIDPPYNSRQYCDAYHFLENVALNNKPKVKGVARKMDRTLLKSKYCSRRANDELERLIRDINARYILLSYNNTGEKNNDRSNAKISDDDIMRILSNKGRVEVFEKDFNLFTTGQSSQENHKERLFLCIVGNNNEHNALEIRDTQSPLNYTGGKYRLLEQIKAYFPDDIDYFYDVFCGGCNVGVNVNYQHITCVDISTPLISLLNYIKNNEYNGIINRIEELIIQYNLSDTFRKGYEYYGCESGGGVGKYNKEGFQRLKDDYNNSTDKPDILFLLLIFYSFNNQIRFNSSNEFNLPVGKRDFNGSLRKKFRQFYINIHEKNIEFNNMNYLDLNIEHMAERNSFLYLDPPYLLGDAAYNESGGWNEEKERELLNYLDMCNNSGIRFALSNVIEHKGKRNTILNDWIRRNHYNRHNLNMNYSNSNYQKKDKEEITREVLVTNY